MFTDRPSGRPNIRCHAAPWRQASRSTKQVSGTMRPVSSATGMNSEGDTSRPSGRFQRTSASRPRDLGRGQLDDRLVEHRELVALDRLAQLGLERQARAPRSRASAGRTAGSRRGRRPWRGTSRCPRRAARRPPCGTATPPRTMPMLAEAYSSRPLSVIGSTSERCSRSATRHTSSGVAKSSMSTANSSPPRRASASPGRSCVCSRAAMATRNWSPTRWPRLSLTSLKPSRSMKSTAYFGVDRARALRNRPLQQLAEQTPVGQPGQMVVARGGGQRVLHTAPLGDVGLRSGHPNGLAGVVAHRDAAAQHPANLAVGVVRAVLVLEVRGLAAKVRVERGLQPRPVVGVDQRHPLLDRVDRGLWREPEHQLPPLGAVERPLGHVPVPESVVRAGGGQCVPLLRPSCGAQAPSRRRCAAASLPGCGVDPTRGGPRKSRRTGTSGTPGRRPAAAASHGPRSRWPPRPPRRRRPRSSSARSTGSSTPTPSTTRSPPVNAIAAATSTVLTR